MEIEYFREKYASLRRVLEENFLCPAYKITDSVSDHDSKYVITITRSSDLESTAVCCERMLPRKNTNGIIDSSLPFERHEGLGIDPTKVVERLHSQFKTA